MAEDKKKPLRVEGVQQTKNMVAFAKRLEDKMNALIAEGYVVELRERPGGMLIVGTIRPDPFASLMERLASTGGHVHKSELSSRSAELFHRFVSNVEYESEKTFAEEVLKKAQGLVRGFDVNELKTAADEFEKEADDHEKSCKTPGGCPLPSTLRAIASAVKDTAKLQLQ